MDAIVTAIAHRPELSLIGAAVSLAAVYGGTSVRPGAIRSADLAGSDARASLTTCMGALRTGMVIGAVPLWMWLMATGLR